MKLGLGLGLTRSGGGASNPYAGFDAAYNLGDPGGYSAPNIVDLTGNGNTVTAVGTPTVSGGYIDLNGTTQYGVETGDKLGALIRTHAFQATMKARFDSIANSPYLFGGFASTGNRRFYAQMLSNGRLRVQCRNAANSNVATTDVTSFTCTTATDYTISIVVQDDELNVYMGVGDSTTLVLSIAFDCTGQDALPGGTYPNFAIGAAYINASPSLLLDGRIYSLSFTAL